MLAGLGVDENASAAVSLYGKRVPQVSVPVANYVEDLTFTELFLKQELDAADLADAVGLEKGALGVDSASLAISGLQSNPT